MRTLALSRDDLTCIAETGAYAIALLGIVFSAYLFPIDIDTASTLLMCLLLLLLLLAWWRFQGGRHPCFLFLATFLIFQGGRILGAIAGLIERPLQIVVEAPYPIDVSRATSLIVLIILGAGAYCVYLPCRWRFQAVAAAKNTLSPWLGSAYLIFTVAFPFLILKNYLYLQYIRSHGGYLAVFTDNSGIIDSVNPAIRLLSLIAYNVFFVIAVLERRSNRMVPIGLLFVACSALELLIGFRGKVFLLLLTLWYISKWKSGKPFRLVPLVVLGLVLSIAAPVIASFRENQIASSANPLMFIVTQGVSLGVTESAVEFHHVFAPHSVSYFFHGLQMSYRAASDFPQGEIFDDDLSLFLNPQAFKLGFGTGSSYLAEAYLLGGIGFVIVSSLIVGLFLRWFHERSRTNAGALLLVIMMPIIYLPRQGLSGPFINGIKSAIAMAPILALMFLIRNRWQLLERFKLVWRRD